jgi:hypothetical protein
MLSEAMQCKAMQSNAKQCNAMQSYAKQCKAMLEHLPYASAQLRLASPARSLARTHARSNESNSKSISRFGGVLSDSRTFLGSSSLLWH